MPITYHFAESQGVVETEATLPLAPEDVLKAAAEINGDPRYRPGMKCLCDLSGLSDFEVSAEDAWSLRSQLGQLGGVMSEGAVALVAPSDYVYGMARMYVQILDDIGAEVEIFRDAETARAWLETR